MAAAILENAGPSRAELGCLSLPPHRSIRDPRLFFIYSCWVDEAAFKTHAGLPRTVHFLAHVQKAIDHTLDVSRTVPLVWPGVRMLKR